MVWIWMTAALCATTAQAGTALFTPALDKSSAAEVQPARSVAQPVTLNARALDALQAGAALDVTLPDASTNAFVLDQVRDHGQGIHSYVAYHRDSDPRRKWRAVITTGPDGSFGFVQTPKGEFNLVPGTPQHLYLGAHDGVFPSGISISIVGNDDSHSYFLSEAGRV